MKPKKYQPFLFEDTLFDDGGSYAYNLQINQQDLMNMQRTMTEARSHLSVSCYIKH